MYQFNRLLSDGFEVVRYPLIAEFCKSFLSEQLLSESFPSTLGFSGRFEDFHDHVDVNEINDIRMRLYQSINASLEFQEKFHDIMTPMYHALVGPDIAVQKNINLNINLPGDSTANISVHSDYHSGESAFQAVVWIPLVDCRGTMALKILPSSQHPEAAVYFDEITGCGKDGFFEKHQSDVLVIEVDVGDLVIFSPNLLHGSVNNLESKTRWSLNYRVKNLFSPYRTEEKSLGRFYRELSISPLTHWGRWGVGQWDV